jgi:hypothetical protein
MFLRVRPRLRPRNVNLCHPAAAKSATMPLTADSFMLTTTGEHRCGQTGMQNIAGRFARQRTYAWRVVGEHHRDGDRSRDEQRQKAASSMASRAGAADGTTLHMHAHVAGLPTWVPRSSPRTRLSGRSWRCHISSDGVRHQRTPLSILNVCQSCVHLAQIARPFADTSKAAATILQRLSISYPQENLGIGAIGHLSGICPLELSASRRCLRLRIGLRPGRVVSVFLDTVADRSQYRFFFVLLD